MSNRLEQLADCLAQAGNSEAPESAWRRAGFTTAEVAELVQRPDASRTMLRKSVEVHLVPALPGLIRRLVERASRGDQKAEQVLLGFLAESSPVREHLGEELTHASETALRAMARQAASELSNYIREG